MREPNRNTHQTARRLKVSRHPNSLAAEGLESKAIDLSGRGLGLKIIARALGVSTTFVAKVRKRNGMNPVCGTSKGVRLQDRSLDVVNMVDISRSASDLDRETASQKQFAMKAECAIRSEYIKCNIIETRNENMWLRHDEYNLWRQRKWHKKKYYSDNTFRTVALIRRRIHDAIKSQATSKASGSADLLGCSGKHASEWIESKFKRGMSWANHGEWEIDHVIPCASFDLTDPKQQRMCFHFTNLQPLWKEDNSMKSDTIPDNAQFPLCI